MKFFNCDNCGHPVFFENTQCLKCRCTLGYFPDRGRMGGIISETAGSWKSIALQEVQSRQYRKCRNYSESQVCNWMVPADSPHSLCLACRLNRTIPDLSQPDNVARWGRLEEAKRRLIYNLLALDLPVKNKEDDPEHGLAFDFLADHNPNFSETSQVITGHEQGLITINIAEADDVVREKMRLDMNERYRTLLGHFRHEVGHYYWQILVRDGSWLSDFRRHFGDERQDYGSALQHYYDHGESAQWQDRYISAYASSHPWEDWAETWAHYLHIVDTLETAQAFGLAVTGTPLQGLNLSDNIDLDVPSDESFKRILTEWIPLSLAFNSINRSMGMDDIYPFVLSKSVINKLHLVHLIIGQAPS